MRSIVVVLTALALGGCFDLREDFTFNDDGTVAFTSTIRMSAALTENQPGDFCAEGVHPIISSARDYTVEADIACEFSGQAPLDEFQAFLAERDGGEEGPQVRLSIIGDVYRLDVRVEPTPQADVTTSEDGMSESAGGFLQAALADRAMVWSVTAAEILDTDGVVNADQTEATVSVPLSLMIGDQAQPITRYIEFRSAPLPFWRRIFR